ncbi:MAG: ATP-binding cassette domain-containing protein [Candidatus Paceibacterota bacterium]|jgi:ATPase subunit of ABC transporter with duplicated ATPase domains
MFKEDTILRFKDVSFEYGNNKQILNEINCSVRQGLKIAIMGQNGSGKTTIFDLITGKSKPESGTISVNKDISIAIARQVIPRDELNLTVREFFVKAFDDSASVGLRKASGKIYDIDPRIDKALEIVNLSGHEKLHERIIKSFSGGQQARILLASALIQEPDLLLLDEPTNNLDKAGIEHLRQFLIDYKKTVIVISHDAEFLNAFTDGVLYLDVFTKKLEQYVGNYFDVMEQITARVEKENRKNAQLAKIIQEKKDKANFFAHKGGQMRLVARRMRDKAQELEEKKVDTRREDKTIRPFTIMNQPDLSGDIVTISSLKIMDPKTNKFVSKKVKIVLRRNQRLLLQGPNGIGKSTLLESIVKGELETAKIMKDIRVGYYRQDFSTLDFDATVYEALMSVMEIKSEEDMRSVAAGFLITGNIINTKIGDLSEGQKGLVAFAQLVLQKPGLLILDEPTNHINFRHIPVIAQSLNTYAGAMILVSHVPDFVNKIRIDEVLDLGK